MAEQRIEGVDYSWMDDNQFVDVPQSVKDKWIEASGKQLKNFHGAATQAQQTARMQEAELARYETLKAESPEFWNDYLPVVQAAHGLTADEMIERLQYEPESPQQVASVDEREAAENEIHRLTWAASQGDLDWDQAQAAMGPLANRVQALGGDMDSLQESVNGVYQNGLEQVNQLRAEMDEKINSVQGQIGSVVNLSRQVSRYGRQHSDRDPDKIVDHMVATGSNWATSEHAVYGLDNREVEINTEVDRRIQERRTGHRAPVPVREESAPTGAPMERRPLPSPEGQGEDYGTRTVWRTSAHRAERAQRPEVSVPTNQGGFMEAIRGQTEDASEGLW